jgi:hypothetical protein
MTNPDFILLAQAMGVHAIRCETLAELPEKMKEFLEYRGDKPVLMECLVETNEHVFPMVRFLFRRPLFGFSTTEVINARCLGPSRQGPARADITQVVDAEGMKDLPFSEGLLRSHSGSSIFHLLPAIPTTASPFGRFGFDPCFSFDDPPGSTVLIIYPCFSFDLQPGHHHHHHHHV